MDIPLFRLPPQAFPPARAKSRHRTGRLVLRLPRNSTLAIALLWMLPARAGLLLVENPGFETPSLAAGTFDTAAPPAGWSAYAYVDPFAGRDVGVLNPAGTSLYLEPSPEGSNVAVVFLLTGGPTESGLQQTLTDTLQSGIQYTLSVQVGNIAPDGGPWNFAGFPGYRVDLLAGGLLVATDNNTLLPGEGRFLESTVSFSASPGHPLLGLPLGIRLVSLDGPTGIEVNFDDVRLDATVIPESSNAPMMVLTMLGIWAGVRRNRARKPTPSPAGPETV